MNRWYNSITILHVIYFNLTFIRAADWFNYKGRQGSSSAIAPSLAPAHAVIAASSDNSKPAAQEPTFPSSVQFSSSTRSSLLPLTPRGVSEWLTANQLGQYAQIFEENAISGEILSQLPSQVLQTELGVKPLGHRWTIMTAFANGKVELAS
jgi:SAM domain (Sterile alpha motif)